MQCQRSGFTQSYLRWVTSFFRAATLTFHQASGHSLQSPFITWYVFLSSLKRRAGKRSLMIPDHCEKSENNELVLIPLQGSFCEAGPQQFLFFFFSFFFPSSLWFTLYCLAALLPLISIYTESEDVGPSLTLPLLSKAIFGRPFKSLGLSWFICPIETNWKMCGKVPWKSSKWTAHIKVQKVKPSRCTVPLSS